MINEEFTKLLELRAIKDEKSINYYTFWGLKADYSKPGLVTKEQGDQLIQDALDFISQKQETLPEVNDQYTWAQIEKENKDWWPTHCEALRRGEGQILTDEYHKNLVYLCQDGPFVGTTQQQEREKHWWALIAQPGVTMCWPIVLFWGEFVHFEWYCVDNETNEATSKGTVSWVRRGHRGGCYFKSEQLTFYRDVYAPPKLLPEE